MAVKRKITIADYDKLSDEMKGHYAADKDGKHYVLDADDADEMRRGLDREKEGRSKAERQRDELQARIDALDADEEIRKLGDVKTLDASWKKKYDTDIAAEKAKTSGREALAKKLALQGVAAGLAGELFTVPDVMIDPITGRLDADLDNLDPTTGLPTIKVKGPDGKISAATLDDLKKEFRENPKLAKIVIANRSSGSANGNRQPRIPVSDGSGGDQAPDLSKMSPKDLVAYRKANAATEEQS